MLEMAGKRKCSNLYIQAVDLTGIERQAVKRGGRITAGLK